MEIILIKGQRKRSEHRNCAHCHLPWYHASTSLNFYWPQIPMADILWLLVSPITIILSWYLLSNLSIPKVITSSTRLGTTLCVELFPLRISWKKFHNYFVLLILIFPCFFLSECLFIILLCLKIIKGEILGIIKPWQSKQDGQICQWLENFKYKAGEDCPYTSHLVFFF